MEKSAYEKVQFDIQTYYPYPVAVIYKRFVYSDQEDLGTRKEILINLAEAILKFLCVIQLQEGRRFIVDFKEQLGGANALEFLLHPAMGHWAKLLRILSKVNTGNTKTVWMPKIQEWYGQGRSEENRLVVEHLKKSIGDLSIKVSGNPISQICDLLPHLRNKEFHGAPNIRLEERLYHLEAGLTLLLKSASFLPEILVFYADRISIIEKKKKYSISAKNLIGAHDPSPHKYECNEQLEPKELYITKLDGGSLGGAIIPLTPFMRWQICDETRRPELFFFRDFFRNRKLEYLSYESGETYIHPELYSAFEELIDLDFQPDNDFESMDLSLDERRERASTLYNRALIYYQQERTQNALEYLEQALVYEKRVDIYLTLAEVMLELRERRDSIESILGRCLDIEPENAAASLLLDRLSMEYGTTESPVETEGQSGNDFAKKGNSNGNGLGDARITGGKPALEITVFNLFCLPAFSKYGVFFWMTLVSLWYSLSMIYELTIAESPQPVSTAFQMVCCLMVIAAAIAVRPWVERLRRPLQSQTRMEKDRFDKWYDQQVDLIFGSFSVKDHVIQIAESIRNERTLYYGGVVWVAVMTTAAVFFSQSYANTAVLLTKRILDYALITAILYAAARYTVAVTMFVYRFSKLPLKPMLSKINIDGVRSLGPFIAFNIALATSIYVALHLSFAFAYKHPFMGDLFFLCIGTSITAIWTVAFPFQLRRALQAAKSTVVFEYSDHIESAFKDFLKDPSDENEARYRSILAKQSVIKQIPVWALSLSETLLVIGGGNLLLFLAASGYVINRMSLWTSVLEFFRSIWR